MGRKRLAMVVYLPTALLAFGQGMLVATLPLYAASYGVTYTLVSLAVSAAAIGTLITDVPAGAFLSRVGLRRAMVGGSGVVAISTLAMAAPYTSLEPVIILRLLAGVGTALWSISRHAFIAETIPPASRGRALAVFGGLQRIGTFGGPAVGGFLGSLIGLQASFVASGLMAGIAFGVAFWAVRPNSAAPSGLSSRGRWKMVGVLVRDHGRDLSGAAIAQTFAQMIRAGRQLLIPLYAVDQLGLDVAQVGIIMTTSATVDMLLFVPAGWVMDRYGRKVATVPSFAIMAVGVAMIGFSDSFVTLTAAAAVVGFGNGLGAGSMMTLGADLAPPGATGEFLGLWRLIGDVGMVAGPIVVGIMAQAFGIAESAFILALFGALAALTIAFMVRETRETPVDAPAS